MNEETQKHTPVLLNEVINAINPQSGKLYFDATFGWGGYSEKLLDTCACKVIAIDQDPSVKDKASYITPVPGGIGSTDGHSLLQALYSAHGVSLLQRHRELR